MKDGDSKISKRSAQKKFRGSDENALYKDFTDRLQKSLEAVERNLKGYEREDFEKCVAFEYAHEKDIWIRDLYSLGKPAETGGNENTLVLDEATGFLYKSNNLFNSKFLISGLLTQVRIHNLLFPETKYELVGFTGIDSGKNRTPYVEVILKQIYVDNAVQATPQEISDFMQSLGFQQINEVAFANGQYTVADLYPRNVLKDKNGFIYVVDDIVSESK